MYNKNIKWLSIQYKDKSKHANKPLQKRQQEYVDLAKIPQSSTITKCSDFWQMKKGIIFNGKSSPHASFFIFFSFFFWEAESYSKYVESSLCQAPDNTTSSRDHYLVKNHITPRENSRKWKKPKTTAAVEPLWFLAGVHHTLTSENITGQGQETNNS